jgi:hypothetical protein
MSNGRNPALNLSSVLLGILVVLNVVAGLFVLALLVASFVAEPLLVKGLHLLPANGGAAPILAMRSVMLIGVFAAPVTHVFLSRLLAIVNSVDAGQAFTLANAGRLRVCAWAVLALELMHLAVGAIYATLPFKLSWSFSPTALLAVLLLFVLAQVFTQGAAMRDDLEGTV